MDAQPLSKPYSHNTPDILKVTTFPKVVPVIKHF